MSGIIGIRGLADGIRHRLGSDLRRRCRSSRISVHGRAAVDRRFGAIYGRGDMPIVVGRSRDRVVAVRIKIEGTGARVDRRLDHEVDTRHARRILQAVYARREHSVIDGRTDRARAVGVHVDRGVPGRAGDINIT